MALALDLKLFKETVDHVHPDVNPYLVGLHSLALGAWAITRCLVFDMLLDGHEPEPLSETSDGRIGQISN